MLNKKAAMFGLDARIALAIFGALSVITGAALYSTLGKVDSTVLLSNLNEIGKAFEVYYLDTGQYMPRYNSTDKGNIDYHHFIGDVLVKKPAGVLGWKGPYLPYKTMTYVSSDRYLQYPETKDFLSFVQANDNSWDVWHTDKCTVGSSCYIWIIIAGFDSARDFTILDRQIDNGDGRLDGDFRWGTDVTHGGVVRYKYMSIPNPM